MTAKKLAIFADLGEDARRALQAVLTELGLATVAARDEVEALRLVDQASLLVAEAGKGSALCTRVREEEATRNLPIVLIGVENTRKDKLAALQAGADEFFAEPLDQEDARLRLHALLRRARVQTSGNGSGREGNIDSAPHASETGNRRYLYEETIGQVNEVLEQIKKDGAPDVDALRARVVPLVESSQGSEELTAFALEAREANDLARHHVNVAILGLAIARELELPRQELERFALLGLVHDLGMATIPASILAAPRRLTREEFRVITEHPGHTREILRRAGPGYHEIAEIAYQEHEREMGQGYPLGLRGEQIHELAKIVGVADVYEACTHARTYRKTLIPYEALQELIEMRGDYFHPRYIKALMSALTVYPLGSYVQLNTGEAGRVRATNRNNLMRPAVELLWNARGERLRTPKTVDLSESPFLFVSKPLSEEQLPRS